MKLNLTAPFCHLYHGLHLLPAEAARDLTLKAIALGLAPKPRLNPPLPSLGVQYFGHNLRSPIGLAAGFDKSGTVYHRMENYGFAFCEIGSITPKPRQGNAKPRLFRLTEDQALINRMGFNNDGMERVAARLRSRPKMGLLGINLTSDPASPTLAQSVQDFIDLITVFAELADYLVLDISCPNTANGRQFLQPDALEQLLSAIKAAKLTTSPPILAKLSPDVTERELAQILPLILKYGLAGLVVSNSTTERNQGLQSRYAGEKGGLTGRPLMAHSTRLLAELYQAYGRDLMFIGVGGIFTAADLMAKILAGASLVQLYTGFTYHGPNFIPRLERDLAAILAKNNFTRVQDAIGKNPAHFDDFAR